MKKEMDLIAIALRDIMEGDNENIFTFTNTSGWVGEHDIRRYLRTQDDLTKLEKRLIQESHGLILDIGCATGYYIPMLMEKGKTLGVDISSGLIDIAHEKGLTNCIVADIFKLKTDKKYNTITLLENNIGLGGNISNTNKLIKKLKDLIDKDGQILLILRKIEDKKYYEIEMYPHWKKLVGGKIKWISFNVDYLIKLLSEQGLKTIIVDQDDKNYLLKSVL